MALLTKIIKNVSGETRQILKRDVANNSQYDIPSHLWLELADDTAIHDYITSGDYIVNNGTSDLSASDGVKFVKKFQPDPSLEDLPFSEPGWDATNANEAILEAPTQASISILGALLNTSFVENGSAQNKWLDNKCQNVNSNQTFYLVPFNCNIISITYSNSRSGSSCDIEVYKSTKNNGVSDKTKIMTWELRSARTAYKSGFSLAVSAGDKIAVYLKDRGTNATDPVVDLALQVRDTNTGENTENFSGDF